MRFQRALPRAFGAILCLPLLLASTIPVRHFSSTKPLAASRPSPPAAVLGRYDRLPIGFEPNLGQAGPEVKFAARGRGYSVSVSETGIAMFFAASRAEGTPESTNRLGIRLKGGNRSSVLSGVDRLPGTVNYFIGNDPSHWKTSIPTYSRISARGVYSGIDAIYYGNQRDLEYDFSIAPGADYRSIALSVEGADQVSLDQDGNLILAKGKDRIVQHAPIAYQDGPLGRKTIDARYAIVGEDEVGFRLGDFDGSRPVVIDPVLSYSSFLGGSALDVGYAIAADSSGSAYVTGATGSSNFPTRNPIQGAYAGGDLGPLGGGDAFVTKISPDGSSIIYSTYLGGGGSDQGDGIAVDSAGNAYVLGDTFSTDFPTVNPLQAANHGGGDAFVAKLNAAGSVLVFSTYLGGSGPDVARGIGLDSAQNVYVSGWTGSSDFPVLHAFQSALNGPSDYFVAKINAAGTSLAYSTFVGGSGAESGSNSSLAVDSAGSAYLVGDTTSTDYPTVNALQPQNGGGHDAVITKLSPDGASLVYSTYLGGSGGDYAFGVAVDSSGNAYVTGVTDSLNFPTRNAFQSSFAGGSIPFASAILADAFVAKISPSGSSLVYSTYLGGSGSDGAFGIAINGAGEATVAGLTGSTNFPLAAALHSTLGGLGDGFISKLSASGSLSFSTYFGGGDVDGAYGVASDASGNIYVTGVTNSTDFPVLNAFQSTYGGGNDGPIAGDAFVVKLADSSGGAPAPSVTGINPNSGPTSGGTAVTVSGSNFATGSEPGSPSIQSTGVIVTIGGVAATSVNVVNATTITATSGPHSAGAADVVVTNPDGKSGTLAGGFTYTGGSTGPVITAATAGRKHLVVTGSGFDNGAVITINGNDAPTANDSTNPTTTLIGLKVIKKNKIQPGQTVMLQVRDASGALSNQFPFTRPAG